MNPEIAIQRAQLLLEQDRFEQAAELLRGALAMAPDSSHAHALLAICLLQNRDQLLDATREAEQAIHLDPHDPHAFYVHAQVMDSRNLHKEALESIRNAIELAPTSAFLHGFHAGLLSQDGNKWKQALEAAELGLAQDPEDQQCAAIRSVALERLGRVTDAVEEAERAIKNSPDSSYAHATLGWAMLQRGKFKPAQESFREALRLEPSNEFARQGMMKSLNSSNPIYRFFNGLLVRISRLDSKVQTFLFIGLWVGINVLNRLADAYPWLEPWVFPISIFYLLFVMMAWIIQPLFNTFLRFNRFGRHLLSPKEIWASNCIAGCLLLGLAIGTACVFVHQEPFLFVLPALHAVFLTIPISVAFNANAQWAKIVATIVTVFFSGLYLFNSALLMAGIISLPFLLTFTYGILVYCFVGGHLANAEDQVV